MIEATVNNTQTKLVDTITDIARPKQESQDEMMARTMHVILQQPEFLKQLMEAGMKQGD